MIKKAVAIYLRLSLEDESDVVSCNPAKSYVADENERTASRREISRSENSGKESNSITNQRLLLKEYLRGKSEFTNCDIREYCDDGYSGTNFARPGITELLEHVKQNRIGCIVVKDFSRFSRDYIEMGSYLDQVFPFMGVRFIAVNDHYDSADHSGATIELDTAFKTLLNDFYCKDISVKVKTSIRNKCERGEYALGQVPFGYERIPGQKNMIRINEQEAAVVRYIFDLAASGMTSVAIEKRLYNEKVPTYRVMRGVGIGKNVDESDTDLGHNWGSGVIRSILNNRFYLGEFIYNKTEPESVGSKKVIRLPSDRWITIPGHHEAIISEELFERTRGEKAVRSNKRKRPKHPLTGKLCCGGCGYAMVFKPHNQRMPARFECSKHSLLKIETCCTYFRADVLAELVMAMVTKELMKLADLRASKEAVKWAMKERMGALEGKIRAVKRREEELDQETFAAYESYVDGAMDEEEYRKEKARINEAVAECAAQISRYRQDLEASERVYTDNADDLKNVLRHSGIERLTQEVVDDFIKKIRVYRNKTVEIEWVFDPGNTFESEAKLSYDRRDLMTSSFKEI